MKYLLKDAMTVGDLIRELRNFDPSMKVGFTYNYGDHGRTQVVHAVEDADESVVRDNDYTSSLALVDTVDNFDTDDDDADDDAGNATMVVLSAGGV